MLFGLRVTTGACAACAVGQEADGRLPTQAVTTAAAKSSASTVMIRRAFVIAMSMPFCGGKLTCGPLG